VCVCVCCVCVCCVLCVCGEYLNARAEENALGLVGRDEVEPLQLRQGRGDLLTTARARARRVERDVRVETHALIALLYQ
jgi:hypothetical protein